MTSCWWSGFFKLTCVYISICYLTRLYIERGVVKMIELDFSKGDGLLPAITQDYISGKVLMLAYINIIYSVRAKSTENQGGLFDV